MTVRAPTPPPAETGVWLDEGAVAADWAPPPGDTRTRRGIPGWVFWTAGLLVLVLLGTLVWAVGGFGRRTDLARPTPPGTLVSTGLYEFTFTEATAQPDLDDQGAVKEWEIVVIGSGRTTGDETLAPPVYGNDSMFAAKDVTSGEVQTPYRAIFGSEPISDKTAFTPGLPPVRYAVTFKFSAAYRPQPTIQFLVSELEFDTRYLTDDQKYWTIGTYGFRFELPVRELPPEKF